MMIIDILKFIATAIAAIATSVLAIFGRGRHANLLETNDKKSIMSPNLALYLTFQG